MLETVAEEDFCLWAETHTLHEKRIIMGDGGYGTQTKLTIVGLKNRDERNILLRFWKRIEEGEGDEEAEMSMWY